MTATGYVAARDALHTLLHNVTGYLTTANVVDNDYGILDKGVQYAAVLKQGDAAVQPAPANFSAMIYEILVEILVRYENLATTSSNLENFIEAVKTRIGQNPTLLGAPWVISTGTQVTAIEKPEPVFMRGAPEGSIPVFLSSTLHVQVEYRSRITGGEFRS